MAKPRCQAVRQHGPAAPIGPGEAAPDAWGRASASSPEFATAPRHPSAAARLRRLCGRVALLAAVAASAFLAAAGSNGAVQLADPLPRQIDQLFASSGFSIQEVSVEGHRYTTDAEIYAALALDAASSILRYDVTAARERVESLAWIDTASVSRVLPDRLIVNVTERKPAAVWQQGGRTALIDKTGRVLAYLAGSNLPPLPRVAGLGAPAAIGPLLNALEPHSSLMSKVAIAHRVGDRRWTLELTNGQRIHLPTDREGEALLRLAHLEATGRILEQSAQAIDLRQPGLIALSTAAKPGHQPPRAVGAASAW